MTKNSEKTGLCFFPAFDWAISASHPEREERLLYTYDQLEEEGVFDLENIVEYNPVPVDPVHVERTHILVPDLKSNITPSHEVAVGGVIALADALMKGEIKNAFGLIRPPGHHAMKVVYGNRGFCNVNNEAILVDYLRQQYGIKKIAIVDTDCHHGDGTQDVYWHDPDVLCISIHQDGRTLYPGTGFIEDAGGPTAYGTVLNFPLPPGTGEEGFLMTLEEGILPILEDFKPDIIINSAGQDNHYTDPLTNMKFSAQGYAKLTEMLKPHIAVLEGGYSIEGALPYVNLGILLALAGIDYSFVKEPDYSPAKVSQPAEHTSYIRQVIGEVHDLWKNRESLAKKNFSPEGDYFIRGKKVFYDTDFITDIQKESVKNCPNCSGYLLIDSVCRERGYHAFSVVIPFSACPHCQREGQEIYQQKSRKKTFDYVYLQDQSNNITSKTQGGRFE
jgi:acetoin utilization deacetylase AcuC-like enzyme